MHIPTFIFIFILFLKNVLLLLLYPKHVIKLLGYNLGCYIVIGTLMYLANYTLSYIAFSINLLFMYNSAPIQRRCNGIKHILHYL